MDPPHSDPSLSPRKSQRLRGRLERQVEAATEVDALSNPSQDAPILSPPISLSAHYAAALDLNEATGAASKSTTTRTQTSSRLMRTASPMKTLRALTMLNKPIKYVSSCSRLPPELTSHWQALGGICRDVETIPAVVAPRLVDEFLLAHMIDRDAKRSGVELEYEILLEIHADARQCADRGSHEAQWNTKVHDRMLSCALRPFKPSFESINITSAKPIPDFAPLYKDDVSGPKIVDFSINLVPPEGSVLESAIHNLIIHEPMQYLTINQTFNEANEQPAVISIESKRGFYEEEDARYKLGMWIAAWQNRIAAFQPTEKLVCTALPGLLVFGHEWLLYWVIDRGTSVEIIEFPIIVGSTRTIAGCYRLVATIRHLVGVWAPKVFLPWLREEVLGLREEAEE